MAKQYKVAGYVKLAQKWERRAAQAIAYHREYFEDKFLDTPDMELQGVYIDITGRKHIYQREEMVRLLRDCKAGDINCIATQTRAYLAANHEELCFLLYYISRLSYRIDIITFDDDYYRFNTILDIEDQREELFKMADKYVGLLQQEYARWEQELMRSIGELD